MDILKCKLLVIGAGPGGYVCAIRAGQLGIDTIIVEKENPGGTCLNVGCIPSKALIHAAEEYSKVQDADNSETMIGLSVKGASLNYAKTVSWKDNIVNRLTGGVSGL